MSLQKILIGSDIHIPYQDPYAWQLFKKVCKEWRPDILLLNGDVGDNYAVSSHAKNPTRTLDLKWETDSVVKELEAFRGIKRKVFVAGNHEDRLERYLMDKAPELFTSVKIKDVYELDRLGWEYVPYKDYIKIGKVYFTHDLGKAGKHAHYDAQSAFEGNAVIGHTHFLGYQVSGNVLGVPHVGASFGWLGDFDAIDYKHRAKARRDWAHGFGVGYIDTVTKYTYLTPVPIIDRSVVIDGKLIKL